MKVREFIEQLQKCDQEKEVLVSHFDGIDQWNEHPNINESNHTVFIE